MAPSICKDHSKALCLIQDNHPYRCMCMNHQGTLATHWENRSINKSQELNLQNGLRICSDECIVVFIFTSNLLLQEAYSGSLNQEPTYRRKKPMIVIPKQKTSKDGTWFQKLTCIFDEVFGSRKPFTLFHIHLNPLPAFTTNIWCNVCIYHNNLNWFTRPKCRQLNITKSKLKLPQDNSHCQSSAFG
jgi:hypothetical protein